MSKISVVIACYNSSNYIEETICSLIYQNFSDLELIVIDGNSTDGTKEIIERYQSRIAYYVSAEDGGQYEAIQKGLSVATGDILAWLNSDDIYLPWTLSAVNEIFESNRNVDWITGSPSFLNGRGQMTAVYGLPGCYPREYIANGWFSGRLGGYLQQESMFWRRSLWDKTGGLDLTLNLAADFKLWTEFAKYSDLVPVAVPLAAFRKLPGQQRSSIFAKEYEAEVDLVCRHLQKAPSVWRAFSNSGIILRSLYRLMIRRTAPVILFDDTRSEWRCIMLRRPLSRVGLTDLRAQFKLRRAE